MGFDPSQFWHQTPATFEAVMQGRAKAIRQNIIILAHQVEAMARQKKLKSVTEYLDQKKRARSGADEAVFSKLEAAEAKGLVTIKKRETANAKR